MADNNKKVALIFGISGQDGAYLAQLLLSKGYEVHGTSRDAEMSSFGSLVHLGIKNSITTHSTSLTDFRSVLQVISKVSPNEIYNLAGQSSVGLSFQQPVETLESMAFATLNILEVLRFLESDARFYNAGSSECFGDTDGKPAAVGMPFQPRSPYAVAKATAFWEVANYRDSYGLFACSGMLFNHESPFRPARFVTKKIVSAAVRIANGSDEILSLGELSIARDWGWAPEYVEAMWLMLQQPIADDFVIATGKAFKLESFVATAFDTLGLDWSKHVVTDAAFIRPSELRSSCGDTTKASEILGWNAKKQMPDVVVAMIEAESATI